MERLALGFKDVLRRHNFQDLEAHTGAVYGIWTDFRLAYMNPAWFLFAKENGGDPSISAAWGLGRSILDCVSGEVRGFYAARFKKCLDSHELWNHEYECSSDTTYRLYYQIVYPLEQQEGLLIVNSLVIERSHDPDERPARAADELAYLDENGFILQCAHCRRVKNIREPQRWDWVPEWVKQCPEYTSHTFCPTCFGHYYEMPHADK